MVVDTNVLAELRSGLAGRVLTAADPDYERARIVFRGGFEGHPLAIARVANANDVAHVVRIARDRVCR